MNLNDLKYKFYISIIEALKGSPEFIKWIVPYIVPITVEGFQQEEDNSFSDVVEDNCEFVVHETIPNTARGLKRKAHDPIMSEDDESFGYNTDNTNEGDAAVATFRPQGITKQIEELRELLAHGGVRMPTGTKSAVLTETAHYIRRLQQQQPQSGAVGTDAATTNKKGEKSGTIERRHASRRDCQRPLRFREANIDNDNYPDNDEDDSIECTKVT